MTDATTVPTSQATLDRLDREGIDFLWVTYHDYLGRGEAKVLPRQSFAGAVRDGVVFTYANLNMDGHDHQAPGATLVGTAGDFLAVPDPRSYAVLPRFPRTARMHAHMVTTDGERWAGCPRSRLDGIVDELAGEGFSIKAALEPEFYLLRRGDDGELAPINRTTMFAQDGVAKAQAVVTEILDECAGMGIRIPQLGKEYGRGQYELSIHHGSPMEAVDRYLGARGAVNDVAHRNGMVATFMPKVFADWPGNSLHVHLSVWDAAGTTDLTPSEADTTSLSDVGSWFLGGLLRHARALCGVGSPSVNSYKRLQPGTWAPANTYWGFNNRSGLVRIPGTGDRRHLEYRSPDNTAQPYVLLTALLGAGLDGIRNRIDPGEPFDGDIGQLTSAEAGRLGLEYLPRTLAEALEALEADDVVSGALGPDILRHTLAVRRADLLAYETAVHPWERDLYLEQI